MEYVLGIDLGGTNIKGGVVSSEGEIIVSGAIPTHIRRAPEKVIDSIAAFAGSLMEQSGKDVHRGGVGCPGPLDSRAGVIMESPNLPGWEQIPLVRLLTDRTGLDFALENDANAACLGEKLFGAGRPYDPIVHLTLGTGIGGGLFINGELFAGLSGAGAELGHMTIKYDGIQCGCGSYGCFEAYASDTGIRANVQAETGKYPESVLNNYRIENVNFKRMYDAALNKDELAMMIKDRVYAALGAGIASYVNIFNPQAVILSGGIILAWDDFIEPVTRAVRERSFNTLNKDVVILKSELGPNTGVLGAAACAIRN